MAMGTGAVAWEAGVVLAKYVELMALRSSSDGFWAQQRVIELGCGTGVAGLGAALLGASVILTDLPDVVPLTQKNVIANQCGVSNAGGSCTVCVLDWTAPSLLIDKFCPTLVLAADCIYSVGAIAPIMTVVLPLLSRDEPGVTLLWCHKRRHEHVDAALRRAWVEAGLQVQVVPKALLHPMHRSVSKIDLYIINGPQGSALGLAQAAPAALQTALGLAQEPRG
jgi:predicted nicotinamide N-methyase